MISQCEKIVDSKYVLYTHTYLIILFGMHNGTTYTVYISLTILDLPHMVHRMGLRK